MRLIFPTAGILLSAFLATQPGTAQAQSWKRMCVSGGATGGANNGTWQKVNTNGTGGGTWKKAGGCITPPPPPPVVEPPPPTPSQPSPFVGAALETYPLGYNGYNPEATVGINYSTDGKWAAFGSPNLTQGGTNGTGTKPNNGRWNSGGRPAGDFEIYWTAKAERTTVSEYYPNTFLNVFSASTPEGQWSSLGAGWTVSYKDFSYACFGSFTATVDITIRLKADPSQTLYGQPILFAMGWGGHCYG